MEKKNRSVVNVKSAITLINELLINQLLLCVDSGLHSTFAISEG
jgi:hypothetical protein